MKRAERDAAIANVCWSVQKLRGFKKIEQAIEVTKRWKPMIVTLLEEGCSASEVAAGIVELDQFHPKGRTP